MTTTALTSELEALNMMLTAADEAPVQSLTLAGHLPLATAKEVLNDTIRTCLTRGWAFNTEYAFPLTKDVDGKIAIPANFLMVDVDTASTTSDPIQRGAFLYDRAAHSYVFTSDLKATVKVLLPWDELPQAARGYIAIRAARSFQVRMQAGEFVFKYTEDQEALALDTLQIHESETSDANFLTDSYSVASVLAGRDYPTYS